MGHRDAVNRERFGRVEFARHQRVTGRGAYIGISEPVKLPIEIIRHERGRDCLAVGEAQCLERDLTLDETIAISICISRVIVRVTEVNRTRGNQTLRATRAVNGWRNGFRYEERRLNDREVIDDTGVRIKRFTSDLFSLGFRAKLNFSIEIS